MTDEYISRKRTVELLKSQGSRDYRREKGTLQDAIKLLSSSVYTPCVSVYTEEDLRNAYNDGYACGTQQGMQIHTSSPTK